jgi:uncharacterized protein (TIGR02284 family)
MENTQAIIDILNDLIMINNDRIAGYEKAMEELKDKEDDLIVLFEKMIDESRNMRNALGREVQVLGGEMAEGTMVSGKIHRAWMDIKAIFTGNDRDTIIANCHTSEDATQKTYSAALEEKDLSHFLKDMINEQKQTLKASHDEIKALLNQPV